MDRLNEIDIDACVREAIHRRDAEMVNRLLKFKPAVNKLINGFFCLHEAICIGRTRDILNLLINQGADVNQETAQGDTPFLLTCLYGDIHLAKQLLYFEANPRVRNNFGQNCLNYAAIGDIRIFEWILSKETFSINHRDVEGNSILHGEKKY